MNKKKKAQCYIPEDLYSEAEALASEHRVTVSQYFADAIQRKIKSDIDGEHCRDRFDLSLIKENRLFQERVRAILGRILSCVYDESLLEANKNTVKEIFEDIDSHTSLYVNQSMDSGEKGSPKEVS